MIYYIIVYIYICDMYVISFRYVVHMSISKTPLSLLTGEAATRSRCVTWRVETGVLERLPKISARWMVIPCYSLVFWLKVLDSYGFDPAFNIKQSAFRRPPSYTFGWSDPHLNERWKKLHSTRHQVEKISSAICLGNSASEEAGPFWRE